MDLNHIELPASLIVDIYQSSLIDLDKDIQIIQQKEIITEEKTIPKEIPNDKIAWKWLGENNKNILIIVYYADVLHIPDQDLNFLTGVLAACKLNIGDTAIVNLHNHPEKIYKELMVQFKSKTIFLFGVEPTALGLPISFPHFQVQAFANSSFLFSPTLSEIENDKVLKTKLWVCLRKIFGI